MALSLPENTQEYRELLQKKGRHEVDKRKFFLISTGVQTQAQQANEDSRMQVDWKWLLITQDK